MNVEGQYFNNPDCLEPIVRTRDELAAAARSAEDAGVVVITKAEFETIRKEVGLRYRWNGRRIYVR